MIKTLKSWKGGVLIMEKIIIKDAYENNLKHLNVEIPLEAFTCVTGCSGCGKSSLVFDTLFAESQRGFLEGMTGNIFGQKLMNKPKVMSIENLRPALNISQNYYNVNPRSTIGTITEISYYLRSLFSLVNSDAPVSVEILIALAGLITCCLQFFLGKRIGGHYNDRISGGQALGQKNTVLAIWMAYTYLNPLSSVGPGSYVLWQNIINSWQLWKKRKKEAEISA